MKDQLFFTMCYDSSVPEALLEATIDKTYYWIRQERRSLLEIVFKLRIMTNGEEKLQGEYYCLEDAMEAANKVFQNGQS